MSLGAHDLRAAELAAARGDYGTALQIVRRGLGLTLDQAGLMAGYSAAQMSRYETGVTELAVQRLRRLAQVFGVPPRAFGLSGHAGLGGPGLPGILAARGGGGEPVERRQVLTGFAGMAGLALVPVPALADQKITAGIDNLVFGLPMPGVEPVDVPALRQAIAAAHVDLDACRYRELAAAVPDLIRAAVATRDAQSYDQRAPVDVLVSECYVIAADLMTKLHENGSAWALVDRAVQAAAQSGDPRSLAQARRRAAIVLRRSAHAASSLQMMVDTARDFAGSTGLAGAGDTSMYANLLCTASYTAALGGQSTSAYELLDEARGAVTAHGGGGFGLNDINLYVIGVARAVGDFGKAVKHTRLVRLDELGTPERHARYWEDTAMAWWGRGRPDFAYQAMRNAERAAPQEVCFRPWAQTLTGELLSAGRTVGMSGLRTFARRIGVS